MTEPKPLQSTLVKAVMPALLTSDRFRHSFSQQFTEVELSYDGVGLSEAASALGKLKAGARAPALWGKRLPDCTHANLLDYYDGSVWTLLVIGRAGDDRKNVQPLIDYAAAQQGRFSRSLRAVLLSGGPRRPDPLPFETVVDAEGRFNSEHGLPASGLLLIRPDGYIAWAGKDGADGLDRYLGTWLQQVP